MRAIPRWPTPHARLIAEAERQDRIGDFPHDPRRPVDTAWNIGIDDYTAIRFFQDDGVRVTAIDYHETSGQGAEEIVREALPELQPESWRLDASSPVAMATTTVPMT